MVTSRSNLAQTFDAACAATQSWFRALPRFSVTPRNRSGSVVGFRGPGLLSELDGAVAFARHLHAEDVSWDDIHFEVSQSQWLFGPTHSASARRGTWRVDLAVIRRDEFLGARLPAEEGNPFAFDAVVEFAYLHHATRSRVAFDKLEADAAKIERYLETGAARSGYVVAYAEVPIDRAVLDNLKQHHPHCEIRLLTLA